jgi:arsenical pump membrane protein
VKIGTYWIVALTGAALLLVFSFAPIKDVWNQLTNSTTVNPLKILILFFSMTVLSIFLDEVGLFRYLAIVATKKAKNNQYTLFTILYFLTATLTIFTSNDIVILTFTPFICFFCKNAKINPIPYLVSEFAAANTWSLLFIIGNPTNIYLATSAGINFFDYFKVMALPTVTAGIVEFIVLFLLFKNKLKEPINHDHEEFHIQNIPALVIGLLHLATCLVFLVISSYIGVEMWLVSAICAGSLLVCSIVLCLITKKDWNYVGGSLKKLPYQLIPFFLSMFVIVVALNHQGISNKIAEFLGTKNTVWTYGASSFFASNLINNIPMSILFSNLTSNITGSAQVGAIYASVVGSNIGAFLTPTGALAGIMFTSLVNEHDTKYTFLDFIKYGAIISLPLIAATLSMLNLSLMIF